MSLDIATLVLETQYYIGDRQENDQGLLAASLALGSWRDSVSKELRETDSRTSNIFLRLVCKCAWTYTQAYSNTTHIIQHRHEWRRRKKLLRMQSRA